MGRRRRRSHALIGLRGVHLQNLGFLDPLRHCAKWTLSNHLLYSEFTQPPYFIDFPCPPTLYGHPQPLTAHLVDHATVVQHVRIEEAVPQSDVTVHLPPARRHPRQHRAHQRVAEPERRRRELVEDRRVARGVVLAAVVALTDDEGSTRLI